MQFVTSRAPGGRTNIHTPLGNKIAENQDDVYRIESEVIEEMTRRLGRPPTQEECLSGPKCRDNRSLEQKMERDSFRVKRTDNPSPLDSLADSLAEPDEPNYEGMTLNQRLAADARRIAERDRGDAEASSKQSEKLKRLQPDLRKIDDAISQENWRCERGSQRIVDLLECLKIQLTEGNDPQETRRLRGEVTKLLSERGKQERAAGQAAIAALEAQIASIRDGSNMATVGEDDPVKYRAEQLMADGMDPTSAYTTAKAEQATAE